MHYAQRINWEGFTTRAQLTSSIRAAPARLQRPRARLGRASGRQHVVDQDHRPSLDRAPVADLERPGDGIAPLPRAHALERRRALDPADRERIGGHSEPPRDFARNQRRLIEAARPQPRPMQRHRHQQRIARFADQRRHVPRHGPRDRDLASVFEANREARARCRHKRPRRGSGQSAAASPGTARSSSPPSPGAACPQLEQPDSPRNSIWRQQSGQKLCTSATMVPQPAQRGGSAKSRTQRAAVRSAGTSIAALVARLRPSHKQRRGGPVRHEASGDAPRPRRAARPRAVPARTGVCRLPRTDRADPAPVRPRAAHRLPRSLLAATHRSSGRRGGGPRPAVRRRRRRHDNRRRRVGAGGRALTTSSSRSARSIPSTICPARFGACASAWRRTRS